MSWGQIRDAYGLRGALFKLMDDDRRVTVRNHSLEERN